MIKPANPLGDYHDPATPHEFDRVIHVLVVDDHEMVRKMLHTMLDSYEDIQVIGEASDGGSDFADQKTPSGRDPHGCQHAKS